MGEDSCRTYHDVLLLESEENSTFTTDDLKKKKKKQNYNSASVCFRGTVKP